MQEYTAQDVFTARKLIVNTCYNALSLLVISIISIILVPFIIGHIGVERFGIWALVNAFIAYLGFFDFSMVSPLVKYVSEFNVKNDINGISRLMNTGLVFYLLLTAILGAAGFLFSSSIITFFNVEARYFSEALFVIRIALLSFCCMISLSVFTSLLNGLQRMDLSNKAVIISNISGFLATVYALNRGYGLKGLMLCNFSAVVLNALIGIYFVFKTVPQVRLNVFDFSFPLFRKIFAFGLKLHVGKLSYLVTFQADKLFLGWLVSMPAVAFYEIGSKITFTMRRLSLLLVSAMIPAASEIYVSRDKEYFYSFYLKITRYMVFFSCGFFFFGIFNAGHILSLWMGEPYPQSALIVQILAIGYFFNVITGVATTSAVGMGNPSVEMRYSLLVAPLNLLLSYYFISRFGLKAAAAGTALSLAMGSLYCFFIFHRSLKKPLIDVLALLIKPLTAALVCNFALCLLDTKFSFMSGPAIRSVSALTLAVKSLLFVILYVLSAVITGYIGRNDFMLFRDNFAAVRKWSCR